MKTPLKTTFSLVLLGIALCGSARGALYHFDGPTSGDAGAGAGVIAARNSVPLVNIESISGIAPTITDTILTVHLGTSDGLSDIQGLLRLGDTSGSHYITFTPTSTSYVLDFSDFNTLNPNDNWTLSLANPSGAFDNSLVSWSLDITAVPEPVNVALGIFAGVFMVVGVAKSMRKRSPVRDGR
jgi:hypothetical protein